MGSGKKLLAGKFQLVVGQFLMECPSPIIVHRCLWEPKEQEQGIQGTTLRSSDCCCCSRSSIGAVISAQHPRTPQGPPSPCAAAPARHVTLISSRYQFWEGAQTSPHDTHPPPHLSPNCRSNFETVTCANLLAGRDHLADPFVLQFSLALPPIYLPHATIARSFNQHRSK